MSPKRTSKKHRKKIHNQKQQLVPATVAASVLDEPKAQAEDRDEAHAEVHAEADTDEFFDFSSVGWRQRIAPAMLLGVITFALYIQVVHHPFTNYDDGEYVQQNVNVQHGITGPMLRWAFTSVDHSNWHPVTWISHAIDWQLFGPSPAGHHVMSLLLHIASVVLLFLLFAEMTGSTVKSLIVAFLFAIHPVSVESVAWIAERKNLLCTGFFLAALLAYVSYVRRPRLFSYAIVGLLFALSLASKAMTVTFPFVLLLLDFWPLQRIRDWTSPSSTLAIPQFTFGKLALEKLPFLAMSTADSIVTLVAQRLPLHEGARFGAALRFENAVVSYAAYLWNFLWPMHLSVLYPFPSAGLPAWKILASAVILIAGSVMVWRERSRGYLIMGWCWFLGTLVPVIGLVQVGEQAMADRYAFLPLIGIYVIAVWGLFDLAQRVRKEWRPLMVTAAGAALMTLTVTSWGQVRVWRSNIDLWKHAVSVTEKNAGAEDVLGDALLEDALGRGERFSDEAAAHFRKALQIDPHDSRALFSMGMDLRGRGQLSGAIDNYKLALQYAVQENTLEDKAMRSQIFSGMASCYGSEGDFMTARNYYQKAITLSPGPNSDLFVAFARTFTDEQMANLATTLVQHPTAQGYWQLGQLQESTSQMLDAEKSYRRALKIDPHFALAQTALARNGSADH
jgi:protein O-mannosyl-transferase